MDTHLSPDDAARLREQLDQAQVQLEQSRSQVAELTAALLEQRAADPLTGLRNRAAFDRILSQQSARTLRSASQLSLVFIDVDNFKAFNDEFGAAGGDEALQKLASVLRAHARAYDYVARYDDVRFALILPDTPPGAAMVVAQRVRNAVASLPWGHRPLTISLGVSSMTNAESGNALVGRAQAALDQAKAKGRNSVARADDKT